MPLDDDGDFIAYKRVRAANSAIDRRFVDIFTGQIDNSPGASVALPRNQVDEDPERTCSHGLHVCSHEYLPHFGCGNGDAVVAVKVDPEHVVAIPRDYNNAKMRVSQYTVVKEIEWDGGNPLGGLYFTDEVDDEEDDEENPANLIIWNVNDSSGNEHIPPVGLAPTAFVEVILKNGNREQGVAANFDWDDDDDPFDILYWRLI
jgi:hypothetical protein